MEGVKKLFHEAVAKGENLEDFFENLIKETINSKADTGLQSSALHIASKKGDYRSVKYLIQKGANVNSTDGEGCSPLHFVTSVEIAKCLVDSGANVNSKSVPGFVPLNVAIFEGSIEMVKFLVENGAELELGSTGFTSLHFAANFGQLSIAKYLLESGAQIDPKTANGTTPFDLATQEGHQEIAKLLLEKKKEAMDEIPLKNINQKALCVVCFTPRNGVFVLLPCAHASLCEPCCYKLKNGKSGCPTCRTPINDYKKIFFQDPDAN